MKDRGKEPEMSVVSEIFESELRLRDRVTVLNWPVVDDSRSENLDLFERNQNILSDRALEWGIQLTSCFASVTSSGVFWMIPSIIRLDPVPMVPIVSTNAGSRTI